MWHQCASFADKIARKNALALPQSLRLHALTSLDRTWVLFWSRAMSMVTNYMFNSVFSNAVCPLFMPFSLNFFRSNSRRYCQEDNSMTSSSVRLLPYCSTLPPPWHPWVLNPLQTQGPSSLRSSAIARPHVSVPAPLPPHLIQAAHYFRYRQYPVRTLGAERLVRRSCAESRQCKDSLARRRLGRRQATSRTPARHLTLCSPALRAGVRSRQQLRPEREDVRPPDSFHDEK